MQSYMLSHACCRSSVEYYEIIYTVEIWWIQCGLCDHLHSAMDSIYTQWQVCAGGSNVESVIINVVIPFYVAGGGAGLDQQVGL